MKKSFTLLLLVLAGLFYCVAINAQHNAFATKKRTPITGKSNNPQQVQAIPYKSSIAQNSRNLTMPSYQPAGLNLSSVHLGQTFSEHKFDKNGQLIFLEGAVPNARPFDARSATSLELACYEYLDYIKEALRSENPQQEFRLKSKETDELGMHHVKMQQIYKDIPVWCAEIYLHSRQDRIDLFNGNYYPTPGLSNLVPAINELTVLELTIEDISNHTIYRELNSDEKEILGYDEPLCELVIYHKDRNPFNPQLTWHVSIRPNFVEQWEYFIDAESGDIIHFYNNTRRDGDVSASGADLNGSNRNFHVYLENGVYYMVDVSRPMFNPQTFDGVISVFDAQNTNPGSQNFTASLVTSANNTWAPTSVSAIYNAQMAYEYFRTVHNRNSYNNQGGAMKSIIHVGDENGGGFDNAFWNGAAVFYGDGQVAFKPLAGALDVGAHEFGHAFEGAASNLEYQGQSGAIAESYADFAGAMVERQNWTIGEQIVKPAYFPSGCLRNMADPHNGGSSLDDPGYQPAHLNEIYTGSEDNGGVHINSGLGNNAFYRTASVIGMEKTEKIFWRACFHYNTRSTQFIDFRLNAIQSAKDLHGDNSAEKNAVAEAFDAVGITDGQGGNYQTELQVNPGQDYILFYDLVTSDPTTLYVCSTVGDNFQPVSQTTVINKPSIVDDGSYALFISGDHKMRSIMLDANHNEMIIQNDPIWHNVATSKDGNNLSAITIYEDSSLWVYSFQLEQWATFHLYNSTTAQGQETNTVIYADAMEWDYSGEYIMYDALSRIDNPYGDPIEYWDINFIKVWDNATNNWGSGDIFKLFGSLPIGINVGNPSFSKNSPFIFAFDILDESDNTVMVAAANFETGDVGEIFINEGVLGTPNYSKLDNQVIFTVPDGVDNTIAIIDMQSNKIIPSSQNAYALITEAKWGVWFTQGSRPLLDVPEINEDYEVSLYPNPTNGHVKLSFNPLPDDDLSIAIFDPRGACVKNLPQVKAEMCSFDLGDLPAGFYLIKISSKNAVINKKLVIR
jgi:Zn-dependent metalloprotease